MELIDRLRAAPGLDFANANYLLSFNANLFETFLSPVHNIYSYGQFRQGRPGIRGKFVQAEPRLSQTAACADEWLPIKPGTEGLLALAMAHVIVNEKLYDADFVGQSTSGFAEWSAALADYAPETVAAQIDVPAASIQRVAREFAQRRPSVAVGDSRDVASLTAIYALNALVGAYGRPGGILFGADEFERACGCGRSSRGVRLRAPSRSAAARHPRTRYPRPHRRDGRRPGESPAGARHQSSLHAARSARSCARRSANVPFIASFSSFLDETAVMADLILPSHVVARTLGGRRARAGRGFPVRTLGQPVVEPRWDTRDTGDVLIETAKALGGKAAAALPFENMAAAVKESFRSVHALQAGATADADFDAFFRKVDSGRRMVEAAALRAAAGPRAQSAEGSKGRSRRA